MALLQLTLAGLTCAFCLYALTCLASARRFFGSRAEVPDAPLPPLSVLIPLCGTDFSAYCNYAALCRQDYPAFELVFGVQDPSDPAIGIVERLRADFPEQPITLVVSAERLGQNPKVSNLNNMLRRARHSILVIVDSDVRVRSDFLRTLAGGLSEESVGLTTCFYRAGSAPTLAARLEALGITTEFAPGVLIAERLEGMRFALGAAMAMRRSALEAIGGLAAVADHLADDYMLGNLMARAGYTVRLLPYVVETMLPPVGFRAMVAHQVRWTRGIRACRPMGHLGSLVTHGTVLGCANALAHAGSAGSLLLLAVAVILRHAVAWAIGVRRLGDTILAEHLWLLLPRDFLSFGVWCAGLLGREVTWRGKRFRIVADGKIVPVGH